MMRSALFTDWRTIGFAAIAATIVLAVVSSLVAGLHRRGREKEADPDSVLKPGRGVFTFDGYAPLKDRPVRVWYHAPADPTHAEVVIVMHGQGRSGREYRDDWEPLVRHRDVLLLAPEFAESEYPGSAAYNLGNMVAGDGRRVAPEEWSFQVVEALFDFVVADVGSAAADFALFGHSAGGQFVHRFVEFMPRHRARVAVAANAGWYTVLDDEVPFPYGLADSPAQAADMRHAFASDLVILLGADDVETDSDSLRRDPHSDEQGVNRLDRGLNFYMTSRDAAAHHAMPFRWRLTAVPGIPHSHTEMARAAAPLVIDAARRTA